MSGSEKVMPIGLKREPGFIYFVDGDGDISRSPNLGRPPKSKPDTESESGTESADKPPTPPPTTDVGSDDQPPQPPSK